MVKTLILSSALLLGLVSRNPVTAQKGKQRNSVPGKSEIRFLNDISFSADPMLVADQTANNEPAVFLPDERPADVSIENLNPVQIKYAVLLDTEVEEIAFNGLYQNIEEWWGTPYRYGGSTKKGIDCSAFTRMLFASFYGVELPRTAHEQYNNTRRIEREDLQEGDLIFFNTRGGISHVGLYLKNNKFVHAATSSGVMISDLDEAYWAKRFIGIGRYERPQVVSMALQP